MGIELPPELADIAATTGLKWPQADEDKLRAQAEAWRSAQSSLHSLAADADKTAGSAIATLTGPAADAARKLWSGFLHPDHGTLTVAARGAGAAADRLTHAVEQVGAAKTEMVRQLVDAAKNTDAARTAASAGHPTALLGLDTVLHGTAANLSSLTHGLAGAVGPEHGEGQPELVDPNPGAKSAHGHGGLLGAVTGVPARLLGPGPGHEPSFSDSPLPRPATDAVIGAAAAAGAVAHPIPGLPAVDAPQALPEPAQAVPPAGPPDVGTGPIQTGNYGGFLAQRGFDDVPTPPAGHQVPGGTVAAGFADGAHQPPPTVRPGYAPPPAVPPIQPQPGGAFPGPAPAAGPAPIVGAPGAPPVRPAAPPMPVAGAAPPGPAARATAVPGMRRNGPEAPGTDPIRRPGNPYAPAQSPPALGAPRQERESIVALFGVHMFPLGHLPVATVRPARQLPVPPPEVDYAPGLRFPPHDHPRSDLIDSGEALRMVRDGFSRLPSPAIDPPAALTEGYDPLGGVPERDWDRRFLVGLRQSIPEYAWPPGELYPEGGHEDGEPGIVPEGTMLDRFGGVHGRVFAADGALYGKRSLPPSALDAGYRRYRVLQDLPLWTAVSAPWFGQPGGGIRYRALYSADELVTMGYLALEEGE